MSNKPVKVLYVAGKMDIGGIEVMLMNFLKNIDPQKVHIDFIVSYPEEGVFDSEIKMRGSKIFVMPRTKPLNIINYTKALYKFFKSHKNEYDIIHGSITSVGAIYMPLARIGNIKTRIIHAHYSNVCGNHYEMLERIMLKPLKYCAEYFFACSNAAGKFCFGNKIVNSAKYKVIKNGADTDKFKFNEEVRQSTRHNLGLDGKYVIFQPARFEQEKNHTFSIEIFKEYLKTDKDAVLVFAGKGSFEEKIKSKCKMLGIQDNVMFLGLRHDMEKLFQAADVFILPSLFEGLPVVGIEAQTAGLKCLFSTGVTKEVDATGNCMFLPINNKDIWVKALKDVKGYLRTRTEDKVIASGYDIKSRAKELEKFYIDVANGANVTFNG